MLKLWLFPGGFGAGVVPSRFVLATGGGFVPAWIGGWGRTGGFGIVFEGTVSIIILVKF